MAVFRLNSLHLCQCHIDTKFKHYSWFLFFLFSPLIEGKGILSEESPLVSVDPPSLPSQRLVKIVKKNMHFTKNSQDAELI